MNEKIRNIIIVFAGIFLCVGGLFIYEVKKEHHYLPRTAEILFEGEEAMRDALMLQGDAAAEFNLAEHITFVSDVEKGTAELETKKKVFGFYECDINRVFDEYTPAVSFGSSDDNVVKAGDDGVITALSEGEAVVTVTGDDKTLEIPVTVYKVVEVSELEQDVVLLKGESKSFLKLGEYEIALSDFYSSDESVAAVSPDGMVTAKGKGKAEIYTYKDKEKTEKISTVVTVKQPVETVSLNSITLYMGESATLKATYLPQNADYGTGFTYKVANAEIANISGNTVTAVKAGETVITAVSGNGITAQAKLAVLVPPRAKPTVVTVSKGEYDGYSGEKFSDGSPYASYFKISFDHPVLGFKINYISDDGANKTTGAAIYNCAEVSADAPIYFAVCINESDVLDTRGFSYTNKDGSKKFYSLHVSGWDGSVLMTEY